MRPSQKQPPSLPLQPYNIGPMMDVPVIIGNRLGQAKWGFIPRWASDVEKPNEMAVKLKNARSETAFEKPMFRDSWAAGRRCLIPLNGFYEWQKTGKDAGPHYVSVASNHETAFKNQPLFCMAGLWDIWPQSDPSQTPVIGFSVLTKSARDSLSNIHHREPVLFSPEIGQEWLKADTANAQTMMSDKTLETLHAWRVKPDVGSIKNNDPDLLELDHYSALLF